MKSSPLVIIVPLLIASIVVGGVVVSKYMFSAAKEDVVGNGSPTPAGIPPLYVPTGKPQVGFEVIQPMSPVSDLRQSLQTTEDDGMTEFDSLMSEASTL